MQTKYIFEKKITKKQMQKIIKYIPIIKNFIMRDLTDINIIKSLPKDMIDDNWMELNYLYNKSLVEGDLEMVEVLNGHII